MTSYFCSVSIDDDGFSPSFARRVPTSVSLNTVDVSPESIFMFINKSIAGIVLLGLMEYLIPFSNSLSLHH